MTLRSLQKYLDEVKWKDSEKLGADMCGRYARCRYCTRTESCPCARAHYRLEEVQSSPVAEPIPSWLLPEPPIPYEAEIAEESAEENADSNAADAGLQADGSGRKPEQACVSVRGIDLLSDERPHDVSRGTKGDTRLCVLVRKRTSEDAAAEEDAIFDKAR